MASREEIVIVIDETGKLSSDVVCGPGGDACLETLDELLGGLGKKKAEAKKPEFYRQQQVGRNSVKKSR